MQKNALKIYENRLILIVTNQGYKLVGKMIQLTDEYVTLSHEIFGTTTVKIENVESVLSRKEGYV